MYIFGVNFGCKSASRDQYYYCYYFLYIHVFLAAVVDGDDYDDGEYRLSCSKLMLGQSLCQKVDKEREERKEKKRKEKRSEQKGWKKIRGLIEFNSFARVSPLESLLWLIRPRFRGHLP